MIKNEKRDKAYSLYKGGKKLIEISRELDIPEGTIRSWKNRYKWDNEESATLQKQEQKECNVAKTKKATKKNILSNKKEAVADEVKEVMQNNELTDKQRLFCDYFVKYRNQVKAYQKAYKCSYINACRHAYELRKKEEINNEIDRQLKEIRDGIKIDTMDLIQMNIDIAFSDMKDYVDFGMKEIEVQYKDGTTGTVMTNYVDFRNAEEVDGTIISEVKKGKDGVSIKLQDKQKAIDFLMKHICYLDEETKRKLQLENMRLQNAKLESEVEKANRGGTKDGLKIVIDYGDEDNDGSN